MALLDPKDTEFNAAVYASSAFQIIAFIFLFATASSEGPASLMHVFTSFFICVLVQALSALSLPLLFMWVFTNTIGP